jgi:hypothetical protein
MPKMDPIKGPVNLLVGAYQSRSIIAEAQRCINLYPEKNPDDAEAPITCYVTPGLSPLATGQSPAPWRCLYQTSQNTLFGVLGSVLYSIDEGFGLTELVTLTSVTSPVSMVDNGVTLLVVDGTENGYFVNLSDNAVTPVASPAFYGSPRVDMVDGYFLLSKPGTNLWYCSENNATTFDALDFATKNGFPDPIVGVVAVHRNVWLIGEQTTEIWSNTGGAQFPFERVQGAFVEHGCSSVASIASLGQNLFWLSNDKAGDRLVAMGVDYQVTRVSTPAIEAEFSTYTRVDDAIGQCYQILGHNFYFLTFPSAGKTWVYDPRQDLWHQLAWLNADGAFERHRANQICFAYGIHVVGDRQNGSLYRLDPTAYTDDGSPIVRLRSLPHVSKSGNVIKHTRFKANMAVGQVEPDITNLITLRWSNTRGASWSNGVTQSLGKTGEYLTSIQWRRLGMARDRVYELSWSGAQFTALSGAYLEADVMDN